MSDLPESDARRSPEFRDGDYRNVKFLQGGAFLSRPPTAVSLAPLKTATEPRMVPLMYAFFLSGERTHAPFILLPCARTALAAASDLPDGRPGSGLDDSPASPAAAGAEPHRPKTRQQNRRRQVCSRKAAAEARRIRRCRRSSHADQ